MQLIWQPLINLLIVFYHLLFSSLGLAIIAFTGFIRLLLVPLTAPSMRTMQKIKELSPELERIKKKHAGDRTRLMQAQADFYKEKGVNPASGCLPQIIQLVVLIALFQGFVAVFQVNGDITEKLNNILYPPLKLSSEVNRFFLGKDLTRPDVMTVPGLPLPLPGIFLILVALVQFLSSKMMTPQVVQAARVAQKTPQTSDDIATAMQKQMLYFFPILTIIIGYTFPLGVVLYWGAFSFFQAVQQYFVSGWGGLSPIAAKLGLWDKSAS